MDSSSVSLDDDISCAEAGECRMSVSTLVKKEELEGFEERTDLPHHTPQGRWDTLLDRAGQLPS